MSTALDAYDDPALTFDDFDNERLLGLDWDGDLGDHWRPDSIKPGTERAFYHDYWDLKFRLARSKAQDAEHWASFSRWDRHNRQLLLTLVLQAGHSAAFALTLLACRGTVDHEGPDECVVCRIAAHLGTVPETGHVLTDEQHQWALDSRQYVDRWSIRAAVNRLAREGQWMLAAGSQFLTLPTGGRGIENWYARQCADRRESRDRDAGQGWLVPLVNDLILNGWGSTDFADLMLQSSDLWDRQWERAEDQGDLTQLPLDSPTETAAETVTLEAGQISGRIVPWDVSITFAAGWEHRYLPGSLLVPDGETIPVTWGHDKAQPIGEVTEWGERPDGMHVHCRLHDTPKALEAARLIEARLVSGFSMGGSIEHETFHYDPRAQTLTTRVELFTLNHLAVTPIPAFGEHTRIVAATADPQPSEMELLRAVGL